MDKELKSPISVVVMLLILNIRSQFCLKCKNLRTGDTVHHLKALEIAAKDLGLVSSTLVMAHNFL